MRTLLIILLLFVYSASFARKPDTTDLVKIVRELNDALINKDSVKLKRSLHDKVQYGHSNGWIETRQEVIDNLFNGKLVYNKLTLNDVTIIEENTTACVRSKTEIDVSLNGNVLQMSLHVLQVWIRNNNTWVLLNRQSTKIN